MKISCFLRAFIVALPFTAMQADAEPLCISPFVGSSLLVSQNIAMQIKEEHRFLEVAHVPAINGTNAAHGILPLVYVTDNPKQQEPVTTVLALMSGRCSVLKVAGRDFRCRAVAFFQTDEGRANFVVALDDPSDEAHIITFSGDNGVRTLDNLYELPIDRMLVRSRNRPKVDGLPAPLIEASTGRCTQLGNFAMRQVSSISCSATEINGKKYDLKYESDGSPIALRRIRQKRTGNPAMSPFD